MVPQLATALKVVELSYLHGTNHEKIEEVRKALMLKTQCGTRGPDTCGSLTTTKTPHSFTKKLPTVKTETSSEALQTQMGYGKRMLRLWKVLF